MQKIILSLVLIPLIAQASSLEEIEQNVYDLCDSILQLEAFSNVKYNRQPTTEFCNFLEQAEKTFEQNFQSKLNDYISEQRKQAKGRTLLGALCKEAKLLTVLHKNRKKTKRSITFDPNNSKSQRHPQTEAIFDLWKNVPKTIPHLTDKQIYSLITLAQITEEQIFYTNLAKSIQDKPQKFSTAKINKTIKKIIELNKKWSTNCKNFMQSINPTPDNESINNLLNQNRIQLAKSRDKIYLQSLDTITSHLLDLIEKRDASNKLDLIKKTDPSSIEYLTPNLMDKEDYYDDLTVDKVFYGEGPSLTFKHPTV
ncbi:MAG: hypothetical protein UR26_C0005G0007 [candidate division TM6 bacterium GW2011_GWF2_32_72]|nr:MAG: hypothetical protein UR26_C0005G0007 [candidate division TM6 bacterium GW2011_GWF2_32_72]